MDSALYTKQIVRGRLYFVVASRKPKRNDQCHFFTMDDKDIYTSFYEDFGPPNISKTYRFCALVEKKLATFKDKKIYFYTIGDGRLRANALFLIGAWMMLRHSRSPKQVTTVFQDLLETQDENMEIKPFRDANEAPADYELYVPDCWNGLRKALNLKLIDNMDNFDCAYYDHFEHPENGDWNWVLPGKLLAFCSPVDENWKRRPDEMCHSSAKYAKDFIEMEVTAVVRLNYKEYDENVFKQNGIAHYNLYFDDGTAPPLNIVDKFLKIAESSGAIAVHCKAGLGRTGCLNACYIMKHYGFTANEAIGFMRIMRPGSVCGPQQHFLAEHEEELLEMHKAIIAANQSNENVPPQGITGKSENDELEATAPTASRDYVVSIAKVGKAQKVK